MKKAKLQNSVFINLLLCKKEREGENILYVCLYLITTVLEGRVIKYLTASTEQMTAAAVTTAQGYPRN